jgi:hypothetical protein
MEHIRYCMKMGVLLHIDGELCLLELEIGKW